MSIFAGNFLSASENCSFCTESVVQSQKCYEDENILILYTHKPIIKGHCLVIPKRHVESFHDMSSEELISVKEGITKLFQAAQKTYNATSYLLLQKNGKPAGQSVPHVHFHFFPRKEDDYTDIGVLARFYIAGFKGPISQDQMDQERNLLAYEINQIETSLQEAM